MRLLTLLLPLLLMSGCAPRSARPTGGGAIASSAEPTPVILVSIDGFRPDYLDRGVTPNLRALAAEGVRARWMTPSFPSITFPNHYTLVTGLVPDEHGIVGNTMVDPAIPGERFSLSNRQALADPRWWNGAEPIWVEAERHGLRTATMFWPGSEAAIRGVRPSDWRPFDGKVTPDQRVDTVLGWLSRPPAIRPRFVTLYFDGVDHAGHGHGPDSPEVAAAAADVDRALGRLRTGLAARHLTVDLVIVSDHGMAATSASRVIRMDAVAPTGSYRWITGGAYAGVEPMPGQEAALAAALLAPHEHMRCWRKGELPARFHYGRNPRVPAFICVADVGWVIADGGSGGERGGGGTHGYDNEAPEMRALFIAAGPDLAHGRVIERFPNTEVAPLLCALLGMEPARAVPQPVVAALAATSAR